MPDRELPTGEHHPVAAGLIALVTVGLVVGLIAGFTVLAGTRVLGLDGDTAAADDTALESLYLPRPERTTGSNGPQFTLAPGSSFTGSTEPLQTPTATESQKTQISLSAGQTSVAPMEQIDLTGVYPGGEGAILRVERMVGGQWEDFAQITANVSDQTFSTYIQTGQTGVNKFRVVDTDTGLASNAVEVRIG